MVTGIHDMIERCREAGLAEPEFKLTDGFVSIIRRKAGKAFEAVGGKIPPEVGTRSKYSITAWKNGRLAT
jgi:predicted HTH transcriptional regulator